MPFPELRLDCKLNPAYINMDLINSLELLEPFGAGNEEPCFGLFNMKISRITPIGDGKREARSEKGQYGDYGFAVFRAGGGISASDSAIRLTRRLK